MPEASSPEGQSVVRQNEALMILEKLPVGDAIGAACSFLLHCAYNHTTEFRRVMNEKVIREGHGGVSLLTIFKRMSQ